MDYWFSAHEIAKLAAEVELKGAAFYRHLQGLADDPTISDMCGFFAEQEIEHRAKFLAIAEAHLPSEREQCYSVDIRGMLTASMRDLTQLLDGETSTAPRLAIVSECLSVAARVEATAIRVYAKMTEGYTVGFSEVLTDVLEEERKHLQMIQNVQRGISPSTT
jgi:rubrerythrin